MAHHNNVVINHSGDSNQAPITGLQFSGDTDVTQKVIDWISPLDFRIKQDKVLGDREPGTGSWFLQSQNFVDWINGRIKVLWCHGIPGSGKTVMSAIVVEYLKTYFEADQQVGVACVYCEYKQKHLQTPSSLLASIWRQLCQHNPSQAVQELYDRYTQLQTSPSLTDIQARTIEVIENHSRVLIVVDAIDECTEETLNRTKFVQALQSLLTGRPSIRGKIHLMMTSRQKETLIQGGDSIEIDAPEEDLEMLIKKRIADGISQNKRVSHKLRSDAEVAKKLTENIVKGAGKMFLLVKLHLDALSSITNLRDLIAATKRLPRTLYNMYDDIWVRINAQDDHLRSLARNVIRWIWCAGRQLTVQELQHALATRKGDKRLDEDGIEGEDTCLSCCHGLVALDHAGQIIRLVHYSAQEYLEQKASEYFPNAHISSAETCLTYLMFVEFQRDPRGEADWPKGDEAMDTNGLWLFRYSDIDWEAENQSYEEAYQYTQSMLKRNPFLEYAAAFWGCHARGQPEELLKNEILDFVQTAAALANSIKATYNFEDEEEGLYNRLFPNRRLLGRQMPLFVTIYFGMKTTTQRLLDIPAITSSDGIDQSVLAWAFHCRQNVIAFVLMDNGFDLGGIFEYSSVLCYAIDMGFAELTREILRMQGPSLIGTSELHAAIEKDCVFVVQTYIEAAYNEVSRVQECNVLLQIAATTSVRGYGGIAAALYDTDPYRPDQVLDFVLAAGGDLEAVDDRGLTILQQCVVGHNPCCKYTIRRLLDRHANIEVLTGNGQSVLHLAAACGGTGAVEGLLQNRKGLLDINAFDEAGMTPLHYAIDNGNSFNALALIRDGADVDLNTRDGLTPLHIAARCRHSTRYVYGSALKTVLDHSIIDTDIDIRDPWGMTPFHCAAEARDLEAMQLLILAGANLYAEDSTGTTGLQMSSRLIPLVQRALSDGLDVTIEIYENKTLWYLLTLMHERNKMAQRVKALAKMIAEKKSKFTMEYQGCQKRLAEIDERIIEDFGGCDLKQLRQLVGDYKWLDVLEKLCPGPRMLL